MDRRAYPLFNEPAPLPEKASQLTLELCRVDHARQLIKEWHSRLPVTQRGPWKHAFRAQSGDISYAVALWNNPSARTLPQQWVELRRMAVAPDAPHCTASWFLGAMGRWFNEHRPDYEMMISYQDEDVHKGTIYKAAGWTAAHRTARRVRDRSKPRPNGRVYRKKVHGVEVDAAPKTRWQKAI